MTETSGQRYIKNIKELIVFSNVDRRDSNFTSQRIADINDANYSSSSEFRNDATNMFDRFDEVSLWSVKYVSVNIVIDGVWHTRFESNGQVRIDESGVIERQYLALELDDIEKTELMIKEIIDTIENQGSSVTVKHLQFDRSRQFSDEDELLRREVELLRMFPLVTAGVVALMVAIGFLFRRRRRLRVSHTVDSKTTRSNLW
jgi:flagellar biosynthesis/type III secretory pathway M-ring protein FliF/YscJ